MYSFIETKLFSRLAMEYLTDEEYTKLQRALIEDPESANSFPAHAENISAKILRQIKEEIDG